MDKNKNEEMIVYYESEEKMKLGSFPLCVRKKGKFYSADCYYLKHEYAWKSTSNGILYYFSTREDEIIKVLKKDILDKKVKVDFLKK